MVFLMVRKYIYTAKPSNHAGYSRFISGTYDHQLKAHMGIEKPAIQSVAGFCFFELFLASYLRYAARFSVVRSRRHRRRGLNAHRFGFESKLCLPHVVGALFCQPHTGIASTLHA